MNLNVKKVLLIFVVLCISCVAAFSLEGTVTSVSGKVEIQTSSGWAPLQAGDTVSSGLIISTGFRSQAVLQVAGSKIIVNQLSRITLDQLTETNDAHESEVFLDLGSINADVKSAQNKRVGFVVNTPVATASVRGTNFDSGTETIVVNSGLIAFSGAKGLPVNVPAGNSSEIKADGTPRKPFLNKVQASLGQGASGDDNMLPSISAAALNAVTSAKSPVLQTASVVVTFSAD